MDNVGSSVAVAHKATRRARQGKLARCWLVGIAVFIVIFCFVKINSVSALNYKATIMVTFKEYALLKIEDKKQYKCLTQLWGAESAWNEKAVGNLHGKQKVYGIPQGKSEYLSKVNGYKQIDWGLAYIAAHKLYGVDDRGFINACAALKHFKSKGWY
jgi:hypothetical protein